MCGSLISSAPLSSVVLLPQLKDILMPLKKNPSSEEMLCFRQISHVINKGSVNQMVQIVSEFFLFI